MELLKTIKLRKRILLLVSIFILITTITRKSYGDAWLQPEGSGLIINTTNFGRFNQSNQATGGSISNRYVGSLQLQNYIEYGLFSKMTIGSKTILTYLFQDANGGVFGQIKEQSLRFNTNDIFARIEIFHYKYFILSTYISIGLPQLGIKNSTLNQEFGANGFAFQAGFEAGFSFGQEDEYIQNYNATKSFITFSYYYKRQLNVMDQIIYYLTVGIPVLERSIMFLKFQKINYIFHNISTITANTLSLNGAQFSFADISTSYLTKISEFTHIEFGYKQSLHFKWLHTDTKLYNEKTVFVSIWFYF